MPLVIRRQAIITKGLNYIHPFRIKHFGQILLSEFGDFFPEDECAVCFFVGNGDFFDKVALIVVAADHEMAIIPLLLRIGFKVGFGVRDIKVIHHKYSSFLQRTGNTSQYITILPEGFKVSEACEKIKSIIEIIDPAGPAHIMNEKMKFFMFLQPCLLYAFFAQVNACHIKSFRCKLKGMSPLATGHIDHAGAFGRLKMVYQFVNEAGRLPHIPVGIKLVIIGGIEPVSEPMLHGGKGNLKLAEAPLFIIFASLFFSMTLIKSISGIRGTIGGKSGENLTPPDIVRFTAAYGSWILRQGSRKQPMRKIIVGRDGRISGAMVKELVCRTLISLGIDVIDLDLSTTPTVEIAVTLLKADGGIIVTASHNPAEWNALKLLNHEGEFLSAEDGKAILKIAEKDDIVFVSVDKIGSVQSNDKMLDAHIDAIIRHKWVNVPAVKKAGFRVVVDAINSTGAIAVPALLKALGVEDVILINGEVNGKFAHNPEPLPEHLAELSREVVKNKASLGIAVDPDVDRLCFVCEDGSMFGEEYTLVAVADYVLSMQKGNTVSNLSSTRALNDITAKHGGEYHSSAVGEVNVVKKMKEVNAVIGGEGNGGIIVPDLHYGRDAIAGIALFLSHLATSGKKIKQLRNLYPDYFMSKNKMVLEPATDVSNILKKLQEKYKGHPQNTEDGLRIEFDRDWVHLRSSNTEPVIRIYAESNFETTAANIARRLMNDIKEAF